MAEICCLEMKDLRKKGGHESVGPTKRIKDEIRGGSWPENTDKTLEQRENF